VTVYEVNADGIPGPTHSYGGLSVGNFASQGNKGEKSSPKQAVKQGLLKMKRLSDWGIPQYVLPPHERPQIPFLRALGFSGSDADVWSRAWAAYPQAAWAAASSSAMWSANAATIAPSVDTGDGRLHATPANLITMLHRSIEAPQTTAALRALMPDPDRFAVHAALHPHNALSDEGAANHVLLCGAFGQPGVHLFVYGRDADEHWDGHNPARQTLAACHAIASLHGLDFKRVVFARQSKAAIEAGAFHNDVVAVGCTDTLFFHEQAFEDKAGTLAAIRRAADGLFEPQFVEVAAADLSLADAVKSYLFNSQLLALPGRDGLTLLAPMESHDTPSAKGVCDALVAGNGPIRQVEFVDVRQSMRNGGGPACLRLRIVMTADERAAANAAMRLDDRLFSALNDWADRYYRDSLTPAELPDPLLITESRAALDALSDLLNLGAGFYPFQR
jgi:succinylarginine dihydrolase